jgi:hypothetical protein
VQARCKTPLPISLEDSAALGALGASAALAVALAAALATAGAFCSGHVLLTALPTALT